MPQRIIEPFDVANRRATSRSVSAGMPQIGAIFSGEKALAFSFSASKPLVRSRTKASLTRPSSMMAWMIAFSIATSVSALNCSEVGRVARELGAARVGDDQLGAVLRRVLHPGGGHRMVDRRIGADHQHHLGVHHVAHLVGDRARADALEQRRHRGGMAQARAMVDVVGAETGAHQLLEQVGLFVRALRRAEAGKREAILILYFEQTGSSEIKRLFPARFAERFLPVGRVHREVRRLRACPFS